MDSGFLKIKLDVAELWYQLNQFTFQN